MNEILYAICRHDVSIMDGWYPYPATAIAKQLDMTVNKVRCNLRKLKKQGFVDRISDGGITEDGQVFCNHGWSCTPKAYNTNEYRKAYEEERKLCKECFGIDIGNIGESG